MQTKRSHKSKAQSVSNLVKNQKTNEEIAACILKEQIDRENLETARLWFEQLKEGVEKRKILQITRKEVLSLIKMPSELTELKKEHRTRSKVQKETSIILQKTKEEIATLKKLDLIYNAIMFPEAYTMPHKKLSDSETEFRAAVRALKAQEPRFTTLDNAEEMRAFSPSHSFVTTQPSETAQALMSVLTVGAQPSQTASSSEAAQTQQSPLASTSVAAQTQQSPLASTSLALTIPQRRGSSLNTPILAASSSEDAQLASSPAQTQQTPQPASTSIALFIPHQTGSSLNPPIQAASETALSPAQQTPQAASSSNVSTPQANETVNSTPNEEVTAPNESHKKKPKHLHKKRPALKESHKKKPKYLHKHPQALQESHKKKPKYMHKLPQALEESHKKKPKYMHKHPQALQESHKIKPKELYKRQPMEEHHKKKSQTEWIRKPPKGIKHHKLAEEDKIPRNVREGPSHHRVPSPVRADGEVQQPMTEEQLKEWYRSCNADAKLDKKPKQILQYTDLLDTKNSQPKEHDVYKCSQMPKCEKKNNPPYTRMERQILHSLTLRYSSDYYKIAKVFTADDRRDFEPVLRHLFRMRHRLNIEKGIEDEQTGSGAASQRADPQSMDEETSSGTDSQSEEDLSSEEECALIIDESAPVAEEESSPAADESAPIEDEESSRAADERAPIEDDMTPTTADVSWSSTVDVSAPIDPDVSTADDNAPHECAADEESAPAADDESASAADDEIAPPPTQVPMSFGILKFQGF